MELQRFLNIKYVREQLAFFDYPHKEIVGWNNTIDRLLQEGFPSKHITSVNYAKMNRDSLFGSSWESEYLCFMNPHQELVEKVNLLGFKLLGDNYTFYLARQPLPDYFTTIPKWSEKGQRLIMGKIPLSAHLDQYELYTGSFLSNSVVIEFNAEKTRSTITLRTPE